MKVLCRMVKSSQLERTFSNGSLPRGLFAARTCVLATLLWWCGLELLFSETAQTKQGMGSEDPTLSDTEVYIVQHTFPLMLLELKLSEKAQEKCSDPRTKDLARRIRGDFLSLIQDLGAAARAHELSYREGLEKPAEDEVLTFAQPGAGVTLDKKYCDKTARVLLEMEFGMRGTVYSEDLKRVVDRSRQAARSYGKESQVLITELR
jgi:hypothetical protein